METNIDKEYLINMLGSESTAEKFIVLFRQESKQLVADMLRFLEVKDYHSLSRTAHGLKSNLRYVKAINLADLAQKIEKEAEQETPTIELETWVPEFVEQMEKII